MWLYAAPMRRVAAWGLIPAAFGVGWAMSVIPGVKDTVHFWNGNWSWPFLLAPALGCALAHRTWTRCVLAPATVAAMVLGFYNVFKALSVSDPATWGLSASTSRAELFRVALDNYVRLNVLPPGWISIGVAGALLMAFGYTRLKAVGHERVFWAIVSLLGLAEPVWHFMVPQGGPLTGYEIDRHAAVGAAIQVAVALAVWRYGTRRSPALA